MALPLGSGSKPKPPAPKGLLPGLAHTVTGIGTTVAHVTHAPPPPSLASTLSRAPSIASSSVHQAVHAATTPHKAVIPRGDVQSSGSRYPGVNKGQDVTAYKKSAAYKAAVAETFLHQSLPQQGAILRGIMSQPNAYKTVEGSAVFKAWHSLPIDHATALGHYLPHGTGIGVLSDLGKIFSLKNVEGASGGNKNENYGGTLSGAVMFGGQKGAEQFGKNLVSDAINFVPGTVQGAYGFGSQILNGHYGNAFGMLLDPVVKTFVHPAQSFYQHPLNTAAMVAGPEALLGRGFGAAARAGAFGERAARAADTTRAPLELGPGTGIFEHRHYSKNIITKGAQVKREKSLAKRGLNPNVARPASPLIPDKIASSLHIGLDAKLQRYANEESAVHQMSQRAVRATGIKAAKSVRPHKSVEDIVSMIGQRVIRTPETAVEDITKEINRIEAHREKGRSLNAVQARRQIRSLKEAQRNPEHLAEAFRAADALGGHFNSRDAYMASHAMLDPEQALRSKLFPYAQAHMGATYDHSEGALVVPGHRVVGAVRYGTTRDLPTQEILDHLKENKVPEPFYVGHYPGRLGASNFYQAWHQARGSKGGKPRTGEAFRKGSYEHSYEGLIAQAAKTEQAVAKAGFHDRIVNRYGIAKPKNMRGKGENGMFTPKEAQRFKYAYQHDDHGNPIPGRPELVPMTAAAVKDLGAIAHVQSASELHPVDQLEYDAINRAIKDAASRTDSTRNVVLVPRPLLDALRRQFKSGSDAGRAVGQVTQQFRRTVLPYSTHWMTQIGTEAVLRGLVEGAINPLNIRWGRALFKELSKSEEGQRALREMVNATFYNAHDPLARHNPNPGGLTRAAHALPPTKLLIAAHNRYADQIGATMYHLESEFRKMQLGKLARQDVQEFTKSWQKSVRLQGQLVAELADRLKSDPAKVAAFGRSVDDTFGQYNKFGPTVRGAVQSVAPFLPWYLNAAKFVFYQLPIKHPVTAALAASLRTTLNNDLKDGQQAPLDKFQLAALARFTPFGIVGRTAADTLTSPFIPEAAGSYNVLHGLNVFGSSPLRGPGGDVKGEGEKTWLAANALLESMFPGVRMARTALQGGLTPYDTSTIFKRATKPGTKTSVVDRLFNPFRGLRPSGGSAGGSAGGSPLGGSSSGGSGGSSSGGGSPLGGGGGSGSPLG